MSPPPAHRLPLFVERHTYRRRRLRDAARALPVFGALLWLLPLLWGEDGPRSSGVLIYLFGSWLALSVISGLLIAATRRADGAAPPMTPSDEGISERAR